MKTTVEWNQDVHFTAKTGSGFTIEMDGSQEKGSRPMELLLAGLGGCTSYDVVNILKKARQDVVSCVAEIDADRADTVPSVFTEIRVKFIVTGSKLKESAVAKAVKLSAEQYCSASLMLEKGGVKIVHSFEIKEA
ncbi:MAG: OsmC family protein [Marinomonas sp.]|jgi:putative redox protein|uniref:OsmC family protein n=1 Tax=unclassified Marinomonas TaxID=196814 RepID=UPI0005F9F268|nr:MULTISPECIES: OsmC family protein [unclassified Marinomonas]KJZ14677.1 osmotically inducible protein OsmC [Marinomonas sp. S3726]KZM40961.1 osmotically inducible protein OsmC [Marinomonas sp. SBI22]KZM42801.1 osmotically inducible protein OsmC [Marinomonas sp. SBI8L]